MTQAELIQEARAQLCLNPQGIVCGGTLDIDRLLEGRLPQALREVADEVALLPAEQLAQWARPFTATPRWHPLGEKWWGEVTLPADFARLLVFMMSDWRRPAEVITATSPRYALQRCRYSGVGGCPERPVAVVVPAAGATLLEFYTCRCCTATVQTALYLPLPQCDAEGTLHWPPALCDRVVIRLAQLATTALKNAPL